VHKLGKCQLNDLLDNVEPFLTTLASRMSNQFIHDTLFLKLFQLLMLIERSVTDACSLHSLRCTTPTGLLASVHTYIHSTQRQQPGEQILPYYERF